MDNQTNTVKVACRTNIDAYHKKDWPSYFVCRPVIGDYVMSKCGMARLKIVSITHAPGGFLSIELHN